MLKKKFTKYLMLMLLVLSSATACSNQVNQNNSSSTSVNLTKISTGTNPDSKQRDYWPTQDWKTSSPETQGMNSDTFNKLDKEINESYPQIHSFLIVRHGYLVFEKYYNNLGLKLGKDDFHPLASAVKGFTSTLVGIALKEGYLKSLDEKLVDFFPEYTGLSMDPLTKEINIKHLLTQTSGFDTTMYTQEWLDSKERNKWTLQLPMSDEPGTVFNYIAPSQHIVTAVIKKCSKMDGLDYADKYLFKPLGITRRDWGRDPEGNIGGAGGEDGLALRPRDMAKLGFLYLNNGLWEDKQIITPEYVKDATRKQNDGGSPHGEAYGYMFWVTEVCGHHAYFAGGMGGQFIYVVPDLDLDVVITSDWQIHHEENRDLIAKYVVPSITK